jgi:PAS domain S-box-containing protein
VWASGSSQTIKIYVQSIFRGPDAVTNNKDKIETDPELFRELINKSNDAIFVNDPQTGHFIFVNDKACTSLGYDRRELLKMGVMEIETTFPDDFSWQAHVHELRRRNSLILEGIHKRKNGTMFPVETNVSYVELNARGYMVAVVRDMTENRRAEKEIAERGAMVQQIMDTASVGIGLVDNRGRITHANRCMAEMFGCAIEELIGSEYVDHVHPSERDAGRKKMLALLASSIPSVSLERRYVRADGSEFWGHLACRRFHDAQGGELGLIGVITDITERKRAEEALSSSEERYRRLFQDSPVSLWEEDISELEAQLSALRSCGIADFDAYFTDHPDEVFKYVGSVKVISVNKTTLDLYQAPDRATLLHDLSQVFTARSFEAFRGILIALVTGEQTYECETVNQTLTGKTIDVLLRWSLISNDESGRSRALVSILDITERKRAEEALQLTRFTVENVADAVYWMDSGGRIIDVNETACNMMGYTREELLNLTVSDIDPDYTADKWAGAWEALKAQGKRTVETRHRTKDGRIIPVEIMANYLSFGGKEIDCAFARDVSRRKQAEQDLLKTQKLESLGILAGGIAHDFNNILTAILGNISLARMTMNPDDPQVKRLEEAERASGHAKELTQQLLTFAKGGAPVKSTVSLEQLIRDSVGFAVRGSNVRCDFSFAEGLWPVAADEGQMGQVFNNLVINACQAMPGGGTIKIDAENADIGSKDGMPLPEGGYVKIRITDEGTGIPEEHLQRIFDPYFTTKQMGSGLGLSIVHSVIRSHNGNITVTSRPGAGTTFTLYLPASTDKVVEKEQREEGYLSGRGRVLFMDDEEIVREVSGAILKEMGYEVEFASDGEEAIRLYETAMASSRPFDAVIMDLTVPGGMGGKEAVQKLHGVDPEVKAIVSSGYSQDPIMANYREYGFCEVIAKPFGSRELGRIIRKVIEGR